jgi:hypothetical protein
VGVRGREIETEIEKEREREREREKIDRMASRVINICIWQTIFSRSYQIPTIYDFRGEKKGKNTFFRISAITHRNF